MRIVTLVVSASLLAAAPLSAQSVTATFIRVHAEAKDSTTASITLPSLKYQTTVSVDARPMIDLTNIARAFVTPDDFHGAHRVVVDFTESGKTIFAEATQRVIGRRIAVVVADTVRLLPIVNTALFGPIPVADSLSAERAASLAAKINEQLRVLRRRP